MNVTIDISKQPKNCDYTVKTNSRTLLYENIYVAEKRLVKGNMKLVNILIFDLPAVQSCLNCADCKGACYALKAQVQYPSAQIFRDTNFHMAINNQPLLYELIVNQLKKAKQTTVRIHSSGDFYDQLYLDMWDSIIRQFPNINFYAYTKVENILDFETIESNSNFNLINSLVHGKLNFGSLEYCKELKSEYNTFICPATKKGSTVKCGKECSYCVTKKNVCFVEH